MKALTDRLFSLLSRGTVKDSQRQDKTAKLSVETGEGDPIAVDQYEPYGFAFNPMDGAETIMMSPGGYENYTFSFLVQDRSRKRPELQKGEVALYASEKIFLRVSPERGMTLSSPAINIESERELRFKTRSLSISSSELSVTSDKTLEIRGRSLRITNGQTELFTLLSLAMDLLSKLTVKPDDGTLNPGLVTAFSDLKTRFESFQ
ncbi:MAG: hypothetical protein EOP04_20310 [Proteobacteria bacterium]|nr:MAG: hypothetical protein EOP04_20310 [Pseudomonadota bacterium]